MDRPLIQIGVVRDFVFEQFPLARQQQIDDEHSLVESGIVDAMGILEIVHFLESDLQLQLSDDDIVADNFQSIAAITRFVNSRANGSSADAGD